jgi:Zn-dependent protease
MDLELLSAFVFYAILAILLYLKRKSLTRMSKIIIAVKSKKGISLMQRLGKHKTFFRVLSTISIPLAIYFMFVITSQIVLNLYMMFAVPNPEPTVAFVVPGLRIPGSPIFFPFWFTIISIVVVATIHEFSHGIIAISEGVPIESAGFGLFFIFFIAFVEPNEKKILKKSNLTRVKIAAAGPVANIITSFVIFFLLTSLDPFLAENVDFTGVKVVETLPGLPAQEAGMTPSMVIQAVNGNQTPNITSFTDALSSMQPNQSVFVSTSSGDFNLTLASKPENETEGYMGILVEPSWNFKNPDALSQAGLLVFGLPYYRLNPYERGLLWWIALISFFVGLINLLPIFGLDGGIILYSLIGYIVKDESRRNRIATWIFAFFTASLILTIFLPYIL